MTIKTTDLRSFLSAAGRIRTGSVIPVHAFILLNNGVMTKTNDSQYVSYKCEFSGECLVGERVLTNFVAQCKVETIDIAVKGKSVTLTDGTRRIKSATDDVLNFQNPVVPPGESMDIPEAVLLAIGTAGKFISDDEVLPVKTHVFTGNKVVAGTNGQIGFHQEFEYDVPMGVFTKDEAVLIGSLKECKFSENETWHFYLDGRISYGWIKSTAQHFDLRAIFAKASHDFEINRAPLISFCDLAVGAAVGKSVAGSFRGEEGMLSLLVQDKSYDIDISQEVEYGGVDIQQFGFSPVLFQRLMKAYPADRYVFSKGQSMYYLKSGDVTCLLMEMQ